MPIIKLQASNKEIFECDLDAAMCSGTISDMLVTLGYDVDNQEKLKKLPPIPLSLVSSTILPKVIQFCTYHKDDPVPTKNDDDNHKRTDDITSWDIEFLRVDQSTLFELIMASNYLHITKLLDVTCKTVANMMKGKSPDQMRTLFNIENDFTPEQEEQIRRENIWCD